MQKVPFFDYPRIWTDDRAALIDVIDETASAGGFILQKALEDFEKELANYCGAHSAVGVANATDGMEIFLEAIGVGAGDEIIISSHTMLATASAIKVAGGVPVPVDIGYDNLIDPSSIEDAITSNTVGIMPTQLNGRTCDMDPIMELAEKHGLFVVEDAAQALGSSYKGKFAGTFGLASDISFFPAKVLGCLGDAGAILVNDKTLFETIYQIHDHGRHSVDGLVKRWGRNSRLDNIQAAILSYKLKSYDKAIERRRAVASIYHSRLSGIEELGLPAAPGSEPDHFDVFQNYEITANDRNKLQVHLSEKNIGTLIQWGGEAIHQFKELGFTQHCPNTDVFFKKCIMLPINCFVSDDDIHYVCDQIQSFYQS